MAENLDVLSAIVNTIAALVCIFLMQKLTADFGFKTKMARIKLVHRLGFALLASALVYDAAISVADDSAPRFVDFLVQVSSLVVIALSAWRHHIGAVTQTARTREALGRSALPAGRSVRKLYPTPPYTQFDCDWVAPDRPHQEKIQ